MALEDGVVMMGSPGGSFRNPKRLGQVTQSLYVYVDDLDAHFTRARDAGAEVLEEPADQPYGDRRYGVRDPEGTPLVLRHAARAMIFAGTRLVLLALLFASCVTEPALDRDGIETRRTGPTVRHWGAMRTVLRDGRTEGRVELADVLGPHTVAVGALEGLAAEVTVVDGTAHLAEVVDAGSADGVRVRAARPGDRATMLVAADVAAWSEHSLGPVNGLANLEAEIRAIASTLSLGAEPFPFRVDGTASHLALHVLDHSCPIARPDGPQPWRFEGGGETVTLVGFYAEGSAGILTHHGQGLPRPRDRGAKRSLGARGRRFVHREARLFLPVQ